MPDHAKSSYVVFRQAFSNVLSSSATLFLTIGSGLFTFPQSGADLPKQEANYEALRQALAQVDSNPERFLDQTIELFEINCMSTGDFLTNKCEGDLNRVEQVLRQQFGPGEILTMRVGEYAPNGEFSVGDAAAANRLIDLFAGISARSLTA